MNGQPRIHESFSHPRPEHSASHNSVLRMWSDTLDSQIKDEIRGLISGIDGCPCPDWAGERAEEDPGELLPFPESLGFGLAWQMGFHQSLAHPEISIPRSQGDPCIMVV